MDRVSEVAPAEGFEVEVHRNGLGHADGGGIDCHHDLVVLVKLLTGPVVGVGVGAEGGLRALSRGMPGGDARVRARMCVPAAGI